MLNTKQILEQMEQNRRKLEAAKEKHSAIIAEGMEAAKKNYEKLHFLENDIIHCQIVRDILKDNYRIAFFTETMPALLQILQKYEGKRYGNKTKEKLYMEVKDNLRVALWIDQNNYHSYIEFSELNNAGYTCYEDYKRNYSIYSKNGFTLSEDNKIKVYPAEDYKLMYSREYTEDVKGKAHKILYMQQEAERLQNAYREKVDALNAMLPGYAKGYTDYVPGYKKAYRG